MLLKKGIRGGNLEYERMINKIRGTINNKDNKREILINWSCNNKLNFSFIYFCIFHLISYFVRGKNFLCKKRYCSLNYIPWLIFFYCNFCFKYSIFIKRNMICHNILSQWRLLGKSVYLSTIRPKENGFFFVNLCINKRCYFIIARH